MLQVRLTNSPCKLRDNKLENSAEVDNFRFSIETIGNKVAHLSQMWQTVQNLLNVKVNFCVIIFPLAV